MSNNNWEQFQSTLLPPTAFERSSANNSSNLIVDNLNDDLNNQALILANSSWTDAGFCSTGRSNGGGGLSESQQLGLLLNEIGKMKEEMRELRSENKSLRDKNRDFIESAQIYTDATGRREISISALEDIIRKQNAEIQALKADLLNQRDLNSARIEDIERRNAQQVGGLKQRLEEAELAKADQESFLARVQKESESAIEGLRSQLKTLGEEKAALELNSASQIAKLREESARYLKELETLRAYVNDSLPTIERTKELKAEMGRLERQNEALTNDNALLQTRFKAINEILAIQENQLDPKSSKSSPGSFMSSNERKRGNLLTKWRTKVFELLVQLKSHELTYKSEKHLTEKSMEAICERLDEECAKAKILTNVIEGKQAEIVVTRNENKQLSQQVSQLVETNKKLETKSGQDLQSTLELKNFVEALVKQYQLIEMSFMANSAKMAKFDKRLAFAASRIGFIQSLHAQRKMNNKNDAAGNHGEVEVKRGGQQQQQMSGGEPRPPGAINFNMSSNISSIHVSLDPNAAENAAGGHLVLPSLELNEPKSLSPAHSLKPMSAAAESSRQDDNDVVIVELEKVSKERDMLVEKLRAEREFVNEKLTRIRDEYEQTLTALNSQLREHSDRANELENEVKRLQGELAIKNRLYQDVNTRYDETQRKLSKLKYLEENDFEQKFKDCQNEYAEKLTTLDKKLNESRREQAKALIMMREMERTSNREKERMQELLKSSETYYSDLVEKLKAKIVSLERERNILTNSVRQQQKGTATSMTRTTTSNNNNNRRGLIHQQQTEYTSFWVDSVKDDDDDERDESPVKLERSSLGTTGGSGQEMTGSSEDKNNEEILEQIRNIMGKLEMSGIIDDEEEDEEEDGGEQAEGDVTNQDDHQASQNDGNLSSLNQRSLNSEFRKIIQRLNSDDDEEGGDNNQSDDKMLNDLSLLGNGEHAIDDDMYRHS